MLLDHHTFSGKKKKKTSEFYDTINKNSLEQSVITNLKITEKETIYCIKI